MDSDEEDVLYAPQNDPGGDMATLIGEGRKNISDIFQDNTEKLKQTLCFCAAFLGLGLSIAVVGPTLPDIMAQVDVHDYFQIAFIFTGRGLGYLGGFVFGNAFYSSFNPQSLISFSLFLAAIAMGMVPSTTKLYFLVMIMFVVGFASGILKKGAKMVSLGIGKTQANGFFRLIYLSFAVGAFISTLLVIPFSSPDEITNDPNATKTLTAKQILGKGTTEEAPSLQSLTNSLNNTESSLREATTTFNESSDILSYSQALAETVNKMSMSVCGSSSPLLESSFKEIRDRLKYLNWNKAIVDINLLNTYTSSFKDAVDAVDNILNETQSKQEELRKNTSSIFTIQERVCFLKEVCQKSTKHIKKCVMKEIKVMLDVILPAEQLEPNAPEKLKDGRIKLKHITSPFNTNLSLDSNSIATVLRNMNSTTETLIKLFETIRSYTNEKVIKRHITTVWTNITEYQTQIDTLSFICRDEKLAGIEEDCKHLELYITSLEEFEDYIYTSVLIGNETLTVEEIISSFQKNVFEKLGCPAVDMTHVGKNIHEYCEERTNDSATVIFYLNECENQTDYVLFNCTFLQSSTEPSTVAFLQSSTEPPTVASPSNQTGTSPTKKGREGSKNEFERITFDLTNACSEILPMIKHDNQKSEGVNLSAYKIKHLTDDENTNKLSLNVTEFKQSVKAIAAVETAVTYTTRLLYQAQHIVTLVQDMSDFILGIVNLSNDGICRKGLSDITTNLSLIVRRLDYCNKTMVHGGGNINDNITFLINLLNEEVNVINDMVVNTFSLLKEEGSDSLRDISEDTFLMANLGSSLVAELISNSSDVFENKLITDICSEKITTSVKELILTSENSKNIASLCIKLTQTNTPTPTPHPSTIPADFPTSTEATNNVYYIIAVYLSLASLLFLVMIRIPPLPNRAPSEELSGDWKIEQIIAVFFFHLLYATAEVSFGAFVLVSYRTAFADCGFVPVVLFWGSFVLGRGTSLFLRVVISLTQYLVFSLAGNIVASIILVFLPSYGTYMFLLGTVALAVSMSTLFHTGERWLKEHLPGGYVSNTFKYLFVAGDALGGGVGPLLVGYFMGVDKTAVTTPLISTISVTNVLLLFLFAYAFSVTKGMNHPDLESGKFNQEENVVSTTLDRVSKPLPNTTIYAQPKSKQTAKARKYKD